MRVQLAWRRPWLAVRPRSRRARGLVLLAGVALSAPLLSAAVDHDASAPALGIPEVVLDRPDRALRAGLEARDAGDAERADAILAATALRHAFVADHAQLLRARMWLAAEEPARAIEVAMHALRVHSDSPLEGEFHGVIGDASRDLGNETAARAEWQLALAGARQTETRVALSRAIAESFERSGADAEAAEIYGRLWRARPAVEQAAEIEHALENLETSLGVPLRTAADWLARADALFRKGRSGPALAAYDHALAEGLDAAGEQRVAKQRAHCLFRLRRYSEAAAAFAALGGRRDAPLWRARAVARAGDVPEAVRILEAFARDAGRDLATRAELTAGALLDGADEPARARGLYASALRRASAPALAAEALWRIGWSDYRAGRFPEARESLQRMARKLDDPIDRLRPRYWAARAADRAGAVEGRGELAEIARTYPLSYYGLRANGRSAQPELLEVAVHRVPSGSSRLTPRDVARPRVLLEAGLEEEAVGELERLRGRARGLFDRLDLARLYTEVGNYHRAQTLIVDAYLETLARGPEPGREELWWLAWPRAYRELVHAAMPADAQIDPALVYAIMREESGYRPKVESVVGARGLLQIMPATGERLARGLALASFSADDLFRPRVNIQLGTTYLNDLTRRFGERISAAIGSYNAGPEAVARWLEERPELEDDAWVESIPYPQTRGYVKRVLRSLHAYRELY